MPKKVLFSESVISRIVSESLLEATASEIRDKYYQDVPEQDYKQLIFADPTSNPNKDKMGKYGKWILTLYKQGKLKTGDIPELRDSLTYFDRFKGKLEKKDINQYHSVHELYGTIKQFTKDPNQATSKSDELRKMKQQGAEKVYEDGVWLVIVPHTEQAACLYGKGTKWCTAATGDDNMFKYYNEEGRLYININKKTGRKYQFHFESRQFMDEQDHNIEQPIDETIGMTDGLKNFYNHAVFAGSLYFSGVTSLDAKQTPDKSDGRWIAIGYSLSNGKSYCSNYIDRDGNLMFPLDNGLRNADVFSDGVGRITYKNGSEVVTNFVDENGKLLFRQWLTGLDFGSFHDGLVAVRANEDQWNYMRKDGSFLFNNFNLTSAFNFFFGFARVSFEDGTENVIDTNGKTIYPKNFVHLVHYGKGYSLVELEDGSKNGIRPDGTYFSNEPLKSVDISLGNNFNDTKITAKTQNNQRIVFDATGNKIA